MLNQGEPSICKPRHDGVGTISCVCSDRTAQVSQRVVPAAFSYQCCLIALASCNPLFLLQPKMEPSRRHMLQAAVQSAAEEVRALRAVARAAGAAERRHASTELARERRLLLLVFLVYRLCGSLPWAIMVATTLGIAHLYVERSVEEASPQAGVLPFRHADVLDARATELLRMRPPPVPVQQAGRLIAELRVLGFLADANARGVAMATAQLAALLRQAWPRATLGSKSLRFLLRLRHVPRARESWARQFRNRWDVRWRRLPLRPLLQPDEVRRRAGGSVSSQVVGPLRSILVGTISGPTFGTSFVVPD